MFGEDLAEVPVELFVVLAEVPQGVLLGREAGVLEAFEVQVGVLRGVLLGREGGVLEVFAGPAVTEP